MAYPPRFETARQLQVFEFEKDSAVCLFLRVRMTMGEKGERGSMYHPAAFERVVDSISGVSIQGFGLLAMIADFVSLLA